MKSVFLFALLFLEAVQVLAQATSLPDCYETFFNSAIKIKNANGIKLQLNKREQSVATYIKQNVSGLEQRTALQDLDGDGKAELVIYNFTGGAHCCDEFYFFKLVGANKYAPAGKLFAGNTCITGNTFLFDFAEPFGYFYTCYACELEEKKNRSGDGYERLATISLKYKGGKLLANEGDRELKEKLLRNLRYIKSLVWDGGIKPGEFDDGRRKALAQSLAVYYFSFGKNASELKKVFTAYYPFKDASVVWKEFSELLTNMQSQNSF